MTTATKNAKKANAKAGRKAAGNGRQVKYPEPRVEMHRAATDNALTGAMSDDLLGWVVETGEGEVPAAEPLFRLKTAEGGGRVWCLNNAKNRPFNGKWARGLAQDILHSGDLVPADRRRWQFNMETIIISDVGEVLSGQHRLAGLKLACLAWAREPHWRRYWSHEPTIDTLVAYGASGEPHVVRTLDNTKPRLLSDVLHTTQHFAGLKAAELKVATRMTDYAVRHLWHRTGVKLDAFAPHRTTGESLDFIDRHPRLLEAVRHIIEENKGGTGDDTDRIGTYIAPGAAAALMYLMGCAGSDGHAYRTAENRDESALDFGYWDKASDYWVLLANVSPDLKAVRGALADMADSGSRNGRRASLAEKMAVVVKGWLAFAAGKKPTEKDLSLTYTEKNEVLLLDECPNVGGIDLGDPETVADEPGPTTPTPEQIEADAETERQARIEKQKAKLRENKAKRKKAEAQAQGATSARHARPGGGKPLSTPNPFADLHDDDGGDETGGDD